MSKINENILKENIILNVGRFFVGGHNKRQDVLIEAFKRMCKMGLADGWKLIFVGHRHPDRETDDYISNLEKLAMGYPIIFKFSISNEELTKLLDSAKIYWHATGFAVDSSLNPERFEHFGLSTLEAMHHGVVPVVFDAGGQPELVMHGENGFVWSDIRELIKYSKSIIDDESLRKTLSSNSIKRSKEFGRQQFFERLISFIKSINSNLI